MQSGKILLLNIGLSGELGSSVRGTLESSGELSLMFDQSPQVRLEVVPSSSAITAEIKSVHPNLVVLLSRSDFLGQVHSTLASLRSTFPGIPVLVVMEAVQPIEIVEMLRHGASDFTTAPVRDVDILPRIWRLLEQTERVDPLKQALKERLGLQELIGENAAFLAEIQKIPLIAKSDATVLIQGETGTGKELCARAVHYLGARASGPFVPVNCGALPVELIENELFGHERGAFTGAVVHQLGLLNSAAGGTLFLDEIDCMSRHSQVKLLRFLQDKEYRPLGATSLRRADVRVIAATNADVDGALRLGTIRQDLYYRLNTISLRLPPLRSRRDDIPRLACHFTAKASRKLCVQVKYLAADAIQKLVLHDWPGNLRELEHIVERAVVLSEQPLIGSADIDLPSCNEAVDGGYFGKAKNRVIVEFERSYIERLLAVHGGNITHAAQAAHKNRRAFWQLIRKHNINISGFKPHNFENLDNQQR